MATEEWESFKKLRNPNHIDNLMKIMEGMSNLRSRDKAEIGSSLNGLNSLIGASMTDEQISNA